MVADRIEVSVLFNGQQLEAGRRLIERFENKLTNLNTSISNSEINFRNLLNKTQDVTASFGTLETKINTIARKLDGLANSKGKTSRGFQQVAKDTLSAEGALDKYNDQVERHNRLVRDPRYTIPVSQGGLPQPRDPATGRMLPIPLVPAPQPARQPLSFADFHYTPPGLATIGDSQRSAADDLEEFNRIARRTSGQTTAISGGRQSLSFADFNYAPPGLNSIGGGARSAAEDLEEFNKIARRTSGQITELGDKSKKASSDIIDGFERSTQGVSAFGVAVRAIVFFEIARRVAVLGASLVNTADQFNILQRRIRTASSSQEEYVKVSSELFSISNQVGVSLRSTVPLYQALARIGPTEFGASVDEMLVLTRSISQLGIIAGSTTDEIRFGVRQFTQGLTTSIFRAEEFNSVLENIPEVGVRIAESMNLTVAELRNQVVAGNILSQDVYEAILRITPQINRDFQEVDATVERASNRLSNSWSAFIAGADEALGVTEAVIGAMNDLSDVLVGTLEGQQFRQLFSTGDLSELERETAILLEAQRRSHELLLQVNQVLPSSLRRDTNTLDPNSTPILPFVEEQVRALVDVLEEQRQVQQSAEEEREVRARISNILVEHNVQVSSLNRDYSSLISLLNSQENKLDEALSTQLSIVEAGRAYLEEQRRILPEISKSTEELRDFSSILETISTDPLRKVLPVNGEASDAEQISNTLTNMFEIFTELSAKTDVLPQNIFQQFTDFLTLLEKVRGKLDETFSGRTALPDVTEITRQFDILRTEITSLVERRHGIDELSFSLQDLNNAQSKILKNFIQSHSVLGEIVRLGDTEQDAAKRILDARLSAINALIDQHKSYRTLQLEEQKNDLIQADANEGQIARINHLIRLEKELTHIRLSRLVDQPALEAAAQADYEEQIKIIRYREAERISQNILSIHSTQLENTLRRIDAEIKLLEPLKESTELLETNLTVQQTINKLQEQRALAITQHQDRLRDNVLSFVLTENEKAERLYQQRIEQLDVLEREGIALDGILTIDEARLRVGEDLTKLQEQRALAITQHQDRLRDNVLSFVLTENEKAERLYQQRIEQLDVLEREGIALDGILTIDEARLRVGEDLTKLQEQRALAITQHQDRLRDNVLSFVLTENEKAERLYQQRIEQLDVLEREGIALDGILTIDEARLRVGEALTKLQEQRALAITQHQDRLRDNVLSFVLTENEQAERLYRQRIEQLDVLEREGIALDGILTIDEARQRVLENYSRTYQEQYDSILGLSSQEQGLISENIRLRFEEIDLLREKRHLIEGFDQAALERSVIQSETRLTTNPETGALQDTSLGNQLNSLFEGVFGAFSSVIGGTGFGDFGSFIGRLFDPDQDAFRGSEKNERLEQLHQQRIAALEDQRNLEQERKQASEFTLNTQRQEAFDQFGEVDQREHLNTILEQLQQEHQTRLNAITQSGEEERLGIQKFIRNEEVKISKESEDEMLRIQAASGFFGVDLTRKFGKETVAADAATFNQSIQQAGEHSRQFFYIAKAAAVATAILQGFQAVQAAYSFGWTIGGPAVAAAFAAIAVAASAVNVANIVSSQFDPPARRYGGRVKAEHAYLVGEAGPELLLMNGQSGNVIPNNRINGANSSVDSGTYVMINIYTPAGDTVRMEENIGSSGQSEFNIIIERIGDAMAQGIARGDSPISKTIEEVFGLNRVGST